MVNKPKEGICAQCGTDELEFYDDGSGFCSNCERVFRWNSKPSDDFKDDLPDFQEDREEPIHLESRKNNGFTPSKPPAASVRIKPKKGFMYICIAGIILLIAGYVLIFGLIAESAGGGGLMENNPGLMPIALMLNSVGVMVLAMGLIYGAATAEHLDNQIRGWMILAMAIILSLFLTFGTGFLLNLL